MSQSLWAEKASDKEDCEAAVDVAGRMEDTKCDYSNTGLNGVLHRAFAKKSEATDDESNAKRAVKSESKSPVSSSSVSSEAVVISGTFSSAAELGVIRFSLIEKAARQCTKGFVVDAERYLPVSSSAMSLEFVYRCL